MGSCSTEKNTLVTRSYHNLTSTYNIFFNGNESFKKGLDKMEESFKDDYTRVLPIFLYGDEGISQSIASDMERALQKATKVITLHSITVKPEFKEGPQTPKQKALYEKNEYNRSVPGNYLLMGKAYLFRHEFHLAIETFKFILTEFYYDEITFETQIWLARTYNEIREYKEAELILDNLNGNTEFPDKLKADLYATQADFHMKQEDPELAIAPMTGAVEAVSDKKSRIRYTFILAQIHQNAGDPFLASQNYKNVIKMNPSYEMSFNAKINRASVFVEGAEDSKEIKAELRKMLKDDKNNEFQDQIYYALGNVYFNEGNLQEAILNYKLSSERSKGNGKQKATSCLRLADIYYESQDYSQASAYYDTATSYLANDFPGYEDIMIKTRSLGGLVENLDVVQFQDSVQRLAAMNEKDRFSVIDSIISQIQLQEKLAQQEEVAGIQDQNYNRMALQQSQRTSSTGEEGGKWYFYNQAAKSFGQPEFTMKWGRRKLEDNWRRKNKTSMSIEEIESDTVRVADALAEQKKILSNKSREYYLLDIPLSDSMMEISDALIQEALYNAGSIYRNELKDYAKAKETYQELLERYPVSEFTLSAYFGLYNLFLMEDNTSMTTYYKESIIREFPESHPAQLLTNPNYLNELMEKENEVNRYYEMCYEKYKQGHFNQVITDVDTAMVRYAGDDIIPQFAFLKVLCIAETQERLIFTRELDTLAKTYPKHEVGERAREILAFIQDYDPVVKLETQKIEAEELYHYDTTGIFYYGMAVLGAVDLSQLKFEYINFNLDNFSKENLSVSSEKLSGGSVLVLIKEFKEMKKAWAYYERVLGDTLIHSVPGDSKYREFIISTGNSQALLKDKVPEKYVIFFNEHYNSAR